MQKSFMKHSLISKYLFYILPLSFSFSIDIPINTNDKWETIQSYPIKIESLLYNGFPFCKSTKTISAPIKEVTELLEDKKNYYKIFDRIVHSKAVTKDIVHIKLDMPFPFSGRDYVIKYTKKYENHDIIFTFKASQEIDIPIDKGYVRLINASGGWILHPINENNTEVTYLWNGELLGEFPDWALKRAWLQQGSEVISWIEEALQ